MKRTLVAMATVTVAAAASAQSSVTLFGVVDATVQRVSHGGGAHVTRLFNNGGLNTSRLGFRGVEDLGGGLAAYFHLEAHINADDGTGLATNTNNQTTGGAPAGQAGGQGLVFSRRSVVGLKGNWGDVNFGRDYSPMLFNVTIFDPFGGNGIGSTQNYTQMVTNITNVRVSNSIGYFTPASLGGFYGEARVFLGENASGTPTSNDGRGYAVRAGFRNGALDVAIATGNTNYAAGDHKQTNAGASYTIAKVKLAANVSRDETGAAEARGWMLGASMPVGAAGTVRASVSKYRIDPIGPVVAGSSRKMAVGYVHNLSKRTALFGTYARVSNSATSARPVVSGTGAPGAGQGSSGFDLGIRHSF